MLEHRVQPHHRDIAAFEHRVYLLRLRQTMLHAAGAQHLKRMQRDDLAAQGFQR